MISFEQARANALSTIRTSWAISEDEPILSANAQEEDFGWVFFYGSKRYAETEDFRYAIAGNGPVVVDRETGEVTMLGTALGVEYQLSEYRRLKNTPNRVA